MKMMLICALSFFVAQVHAEVKVDGLTPAPAFSEKDAAGKTHNLADYKGKWVVLEWYNKDCPYVKKHYDTKRKNMQNLQKEYTGKGVVWLSVVSSAEGEQGYLKPADAVANAKKVASAASATLIDVDGNMGKDYGAETTPHMYVINPEGNLIYAGGIDNDKSADPKTIDTAKRKYVKEALDADMATPKRKVATMTAAPYGCGIKYKN